MLQVKTYLAPDQYGGQGLFAGQDIEKGQVVWRYDAGTTIYIPAADFIAMATQEKNRIARHTYPVYIPAETPPMVGVMLNKGADQCTNHSDDPNTGHTPDDPDINIALRAIKKGEEITCNYFEFDPQDVIHKMGIRTGKTFLLADHDHAVKTQATD